MEHLVRNCFKGEGYVFATGAAEIARASGNEKIARLASNENPFPPPAGAINAGVDALHSVNRYPDERVEGLIAALQARHGAFHFVTGVGMDGIIETVIRVLVDPGDKVAVSIPTFSFYGLAARAQGGEVINIQRDEDFAVDPARFVREARGAKVAFICSPNNPTGNAITLECVDEIAAGLDGILFLDNAYVEFADCPYQELLTHHENLIIGRTFSKIYALAGLRVGYAFVPGWFVPYYLRAQTPFALSTVAAAAAEGALADGAYPRTYREHVLRWRARFSREIPLRTYPSDANFVLVNVAPHTGEEAVETLAKHGVVVRSCTSFPGLGDHYIRVSIGEDWENERFLQEIGKL